MRYGQTCGAVQLTLSNTPTSHHPRLQTVHRGKQNELEPVSLCSEYPCRLTYEGRALNEPEEKRLQSGVVVSEPWGTDVRLYVGGWGTGWWEGQCTWGGIDGGRGNACLNEEGV